MMADKDPGRGPEGKSISSRFLLAITTVPDKKTGEKIARALVEEKLAACVNISGPWESRYWWEGNFTEDREHLLLIKTRSGLYQKLEKRIRSLHPYRLPEIIALPVLKGSKKYLAWLAAVTMS